MLDGKPNNTIGAAAMWKERLGWILDPFMSLAVIGGVIWGISFINWSSVWDMVGISPSPTRFVHKYREDPETAIKEYSLSTDEDAMLQWEVVMDDIPDDAEILGHEYVTTVYFKKDVTNKITLYLVKFRKGDEMDYILIASHVAKEKKFTPGWSARVIEGVPERIKELMTDD